MSFNKPESFRFFRANSINPDRLSAAERVGELAASWPPA
jgi:hypothetical protein